jgi:hypothetical protein
MYKDFSCSLIVLLTKLHSQEHDNRKPWLFTSDYNIWLYQAENIRNAMSFRRSVATEKSCFYINIKIPHIRSG